MALNPTIKDTILMIQIKTKEALAEENMDKKNEILCEIIDMLDTNKVLTNLRTLFENYNVISLPTPEDADWRMTIG